MPSHHGYAVCRGCLKQRQTTSTGLITSHRRWNGREMIHCPGSLHSPVKKR